MTLKDTIIAISTPRGSGGLGIVRLSGDRALAIAKKIFTPRGKAAKKIAPRCLIFGNLFDPGRKESLDEAFLTYFPKPSSYTREDVVEFSCHGSPVILEEAVRLAVREGARPAHPGEFTLRAYLRGRIDILQAEAINDLIMATSLKQAKISFRQLEGRLSRRIGLLRQEVIRLLSLIEASLEFPEDDLPVTTEDIAQGLDKAISSIERLVDSYDSGKVLTEGLTLVIVGRANVGKSTLFNALLDEDRAIVSPYPGTTRDYLREKIKIKDAIFHLIDMAGLEKPRHPVEREGVRRGRELASRADGVLIILDSSRRNSPSDLKLIQRYENKKAILLFNKIDLPQKMDVQNIKDSTKVPLSLDISALKGTNLDKLREMIHSCFVPNDKGDEEVILHLRQKLALEEILSALNSARRALNEGYSEEVVADEIRPVLPLIGHLTGEIRAEEVIERIFSHFCVGK